MTVFEMLQAYAQPKGMDIVYGRHTKEVKTPYLLLTGAGQDHFEADTTYYVTQDRWTLEYYYAQKDPEIEGEIEALLLKNGFRYEKSEDLYLDDQEVFMIYYDF